MTDPELQLAYTKALSQLEDMIDTLDKLGPGYARSYMDYTPRKGRATPRGNMPPLLARVVREAVDDALVSVAQGAER